MALTMSRERCADCPVLQGGDVDRMETALSMEGLPTVCISGNLERCGLDPRVQQAAAAAIRFAAAIVEMPTTKLAEVEA